MRQTHSYGASTRVKDPDWRPTPTPTGFWPLPEGHPLVACGRCSAVLPATERAQAGHRRHHEQIDGHDPR